MKKNNSSTEAVGTCIGGCLAYGGMVVCSVIIYGVIIGAIVVVGIGVARLMGVPI